MASAPPPALSEGAPPLLNEPPPTYNDATGTLNIRQDGLSTQTQVSNDGRVDIRIDESDERLAKEIQQLQLASLQESSETPTPLYTPTSYGQLYEAPPPLNIVVHVVGSRGDVQPFVALGRELKNSYGHRVRIATHGTFKKFVEENGLEFFEIGGDPAELMAFMVKNPGLIPGMKSLKAGDVGKRRKGMAEILEGCWKSCADANEVEKADEDTPSATKTKPFIAHAIIANPPSFAHIHCAEKLGIPLHLMFTMPWSPTHDFPHPLANIKSSNATGSMTNEMSYTLVDMMTWQGLGDITNKFRKETLGLGEITQAAATTMLHRLRIPYTYCWSPALIPKPKDWGSHIDISGFYFLSLASNYQPDPDLAAFLAAGPPPVYIGFGSIVVDDPNAMTTLIFDAVRKTGQRALVSKGWGGLGGDDLAKPDNVFMLGNCPHDWLFQHVSCVVHHGGAGTTAAGIALGRPTVIVPFFGDQPFWGAMVARAGAGPTPIPYKDLTAQGLADSILHALKPETLERARELGERIREEKGCEAGAASFHAQMHVDALRCAIVPSRPAVWRVKTKDSTTADVRLSAFAATVLGNEHLLDINQLRLYRPYEYAVEESAVISNVTGANPVLNTLGSLASGIIHWPVNVGKAYAGIVYEPYKGARADGWRGFGKGLGKGFGHLLFPKRGLVIGGRPYGIRALYDTIKKRMGSGTLSFILAAHFALGFEEVKKSTEEERVEVLTRWNELAPVLKRETSGASSSWSLSKSSTRDSSRSTSTSKSRRRDESAPPTPSSET
ncbi:UDP-Glycosyltransferase/glycogen phosphorylase [Mytilinidion resinicola]|uniref:UDP-Glycosyltransferase/glycogen phosphorylase n=1 Tax=Mytilinidion resinicola TaxID=574789 RepID=A0A6A6Z1M5_9PEZI|nr:UDP-Glycosyltransferase/glycogen phosphorylase [Mytilinidion resinicola]KAF2814137.1 UDP-Glycosyltransferase/glycogen phosphorylase [Mytilinidion resinicola]